MAFRRGELGGPCLAFAAGALVTLAAVKLLAPATDSPPYYAHQHSIAKMMNPKYETTKVPRSWMRPWDGLPSMRCKTSPHESKFSQLVKAMFEDGLINDGSVVDSGAHHGGESCFYSELDTSRIVHAVEPIADNVRKIQSLYPDRLNLWPLHAALGQDTAP